MLLEGFSLNKLGSEWAVDFTIYFWKKSYLQIRGRICCSLE